MAKHFTDETAEFAMPRPSRHAAPDTGQLEPTLRFVPDFALTRPGVPAVASRDGATR